MLTLTPCVCILAAIAFSKLFSIYLKVIRTNASRDSSYSINQKCLTLWLYRISGLFYIRYPAVIRFHLPDIYFYFVSLNPLTNQDLSWHLSEWWLFGFTRETARLYCNRLQVEPFLTGVLSRHSINNRDSGDKWITFYYSPSCVTQEDEGPKDEDPETNEKNGRLYDKAGKIRKMKHEQVQSTFLHI